MLDPGTMKEVNIQLDPMTDTVVTDAGEILHTEEYTLYVGLSQPDEDSVSRCGAQPVAIVKQTKVR